jgi:hypothetical protein
VSVVNVPGTALGTMVLSGELDMIPVGFAMNAVKSGPEGGQSVNVLSRGFYTSDDGPELYAYLDQLFFYV